MHNERYLQRKRILPNQPESESGVFMTFKEASDRIQFHCWTIVPFGFALFMLAFLFYGCTEKSPENLPVKQTITNENLQTAYAKQMRQHFMYAKFVRPAEKEKQVNTANLYRAIARSEEIHAANHSSLMRARGIEPKAPQYDSVAVGTIVQTLKMSMGSEDIETESMFPNLIRTAGLEKDTVAMNQFQMTMEADNRQSELLKDAADHLGKIPKVPYLVCPGCGYIITSEQTEECPVCHARKEKFEKIS
jgi:rubrerythrin